MNILTFSLNWNNKLECDCFSTIRLRSDSKYYLGAGFQVHLYDNKKQVIKSFHATVVSITPFKLDKMTDAMAYIDTTYCAEDCRELIRTMYKKSNIDWSVQELSFVVLKKVKQ